MLANGLPDGFGPEQLHKWVHECCQIDSDVMGRIINRSPTLPTKGWIIMNIAIFEFMSDKIMKSVKKQMESESPGIEQEIKQMKSRIESVLSDEIDVLIVGVRGERK